MAEKIKEFKLDIAQLETLEAATTRQRVKDILSLAKRKLVSEVITLEETLKMDTSNIPSTTSHTRSSPQRYEVKLNNYAYDQTKKFLKFYVTLANVQKLPTENVKCTFKAKSLELKIENLDNKDYIFKINNLLHCIEPQNSFWKTKTDKVIIAVAKKEEIQWSYITEWEKKAKEGTKPKLDDKDAKADPSDSLMSLMKNMYDQGDDEMKRTIAKAWTESQQKSTTI